MAGTGSPHATVDAMDERTSELVGVAPCSPFRRRKVLTPRVVIYALAVAAYVVSLFLPAVGVSVLGPPSTLYGCEAFTASLRSFPDVLKDFPSDLFSLCACVAWLANPVLWVGMILVAWRRYGSGCMAGAMAVALAMPIWLEIDEVYAGYYLWVLSMALLMLAAGAGWLAERREASARGFDVIQ